MRSHDRWVLMLTCVYRCGFVMQRAGMRTCGHGAERMAHCMPAKHGAYCWHACVLHAHRGAQCKQSWRSHRPWQCPRARLASRCAGHTALWVPGGSCRLLLRLVSLGATSAAHRPPKPPHVRPPQHPSAQPQPQCWLPASPALEALCPRRRQSTFRPRLRHRHPCRPQPEFDDRRWGPSLDNGPSPTPHHHRQQLRWRCQGFQTRSSSSCFLQATSGAQVNFESLRRPQLSSSLPHPALI